MEKMTQEQAFSVLILWYTNRSVKDMEGKKARAQPCKGPETAIGSTNGYRGKKKPCQDDPPNRAAGGGNEEKEAKLHSDY